MDAQEWKAGWYPDPHGGSGVRWWDGDRWTGDVRDEHPSAAPSTTPQDEVGAALTLTRVHVQQSAGRLLTEPRYLVADPWGRPVASVWERPFLSGTRRLKAATLDAAMPDGRGLFRITQDPAIVGPVYAAAGLPSPPPGSRVVFDGGGAAVALSRTEGGAASQRRVVDVVGLPTPLVLSGPQVGARRSPRPVLLAGAPVAHITLVSGRLAPDAYVVDIPGAPHDEPLGVTLLAIGVLYDQIYREPEGSATHDSGLAVDPTAT